MDAGFVYIVWYWMDGPIEIQLGKASTKEWMDRGCCCCLHLFTMYTLYTNLICQNMFDVIYVYRTHPSHYYTNIYIYLILAIYTTNLICYMWCIYIYIHISNHYINGIARIDPQTPLFRTWRSNAWSSARKCSICSAGWPRCPRIRHNTCSRKRGRRSAWRSFLVKKSW